MTGLLLPSAAELLRYHLLLGRVEGNNKNPKTESKINHFERRTRYSNDLTGTIIAIYGWTVRAS